MAKPKLGSGARFAALKSKLAKRPGVTNPGGLAAFIGRKKYGPKKFAALGAKGRTKAAAKGFSGVVDRETHFIAGEGNRPEYVNIKPLTEHQAQRLRANDHALDQAMGKFRRG